MAVSLLLWCIKPIGSRRWFPSISWKFRWSRNGRKVDEIEHRGHQIEDFDSKINIPRSKYIWKAKKKYRKLRSKFSKFCKMLAGSNRLYAISYYSNKIETAICIYIYIYMRMCAYIYIYIHMYTHRHTYNIHT